MSVKQVLSRIHTAFSAVPWRSLVILFCGCLICTALWAEVQQTRLAGSVIRLHMLANSDSPADQALKLQVRDRVLAQARTILADTTDARTAADLLSGNLATLALTAEQTVADAGYPYQVLVRLEKTWFPTRRYESLSLPAGNYTALRVLIGTGEGHNWWCVVFPSLCLPAVSQQAAAVSGLTGRDYALLTEESRPYEIGFKTMEIWQTCKHWLAGR